MLGIPIYFLVTMSFSSSSPSDEARNIVIGLLQFGQPSTKEDYVNREIYLFHYLNLGWKSDNLDSQKCVYTNRPNRC